MTKKRQERKRKKEEKQQKKLNKNIERAERKKILLEEADVSEMSTQQKIWIYTRMVIYAAKPFIVYMITPAIAIAIGGFLYYGRDFTENTEFLDSAMNFYSFIGILLALWYLRRNSKKRGTTVAEDVSISFKELDKKVLWLLFAGGFCASFEISALYTLLPEAWTASYDAMSGRIFNGYDVILVIVSISILDPIAEELVFRGYMLNRLLPRLKETKAVWAVTIIFALCHLSPLWILYGIAIGWILAKISIRHDNILYSMALHVGFNIPSVIFFLISYNEKLNDILFGTKFLIFCYLLIFGGIVFFIVKAYCENQNIEIEIKKYSKDKKRREN